MFKFSDIRYLLKLVVPYLKLDLYDISQLQYIPNKEWIEMYSTMRLYRDGKKFTVEVDGRTSFNSIEDILFWGYTSSTQLFDTFAYISKIFNSKKIVQNNEFDNVVKTIKFMNRLNLDFYFYTYNSSMDLIETDISKIDEIIANELPFSFDSMLHKENVLYCEYVDEKYVVRDCNSLYDTSIEKIKIYELIKLV